jgi:hypothetical protein
MNRAAVIAQPRKIIHRTGHRDFPNQRDNLAGSGLLNCMFNRVIHGYAHILILDSIRFGNKKGLPLLYDRPRRLFSSGTETIRYLSSHSTGHHHNKLEEMFLFIETIMPYIGGNVNHKN